MAIMIYTIAHCCRLSRSGVAKPNRIPVPGRVLAEADTPAWYATEGAHAVRFDLKEPLGRGQGDVYDPASEFCSHNSAFGGGMGAGRATHRVQAQP